MIELTSRQNWFKQQFERQTQHYSHPSRSQICLLVGIIATAYLFIYFVWEAGKNALPPEASEIDITAPTKSSHPLSVLVNTARQEFSDLSFKQSQSLTEAATEYKRRYGLDPPPYFDKWYEFVKDNNVPLVDEYNGIHETLQPFWGFSPRAIRHKVRGAIASDDFIIPVFIRNGKIKDIERGPDWRKEAIKNAIKPFAHLLPDMDLAFNMHDEPRVIMPHDELAQMLERSLVAQRSQSLQRNAWSNHPADLNSGSIEISKVTPFLEYAHQFTWPVATLSCPPDSPARISNYDGVPQPDKNDAYLTSPIGYIWNRTAFTDICLSPSLKDVHGFFNMPNAWSITHDPIPIFSPSKASSFHDILFPAPWYLGDMAVYDEAKDMSWAEKNDTLYWRGSTTSGYSDGGMWRRQERQRFVEAVEKPGHALILEADAYGKWLPKAVARESHKDLFDVHFSDVGQCSDTDCAEQLHYFDTKPRDAYEVNWQHKFLLDIDGNAFSGRFYTFLKSHSCILKQALYREWHEDRIAPWVHYIPLGLNGSDHLETMRFLTQEEDGRQLAQKIAEESTNWAFQSLRHVDMQAWIFRLLLEYARLVDDARGEIGFALS